MTNKWVKLGNGVDRFEYTCTHMCVSICAQVEGVGKALTDE